MTKNGLETKKSLFMSLFNRRGKYKEKHARRTLKEYFHKIKGEDSKDAKLPIKKLM